MHLYAASLASSSSARSDRNGHSLLQQNNPNHYHYTTAHHSTSPANQATSQLIMHRYKAKTSQLPSPIANKRHQTAPIHAPNSAGPLSAGMDHHVYPQPGTSKDTSNLDNGEPQTPKSGRKWKKSKAAKQGSGSSSSTQHTPQSVLGVRLADCATAKNNEHVPLLVQICVSVVEAHGMDTIGIYRIPGNTAAVNALKETLSHNMDSVNLEQLRKLPRHHYETLKFLIIHLAEITKNSDVNKMETRNLALMFGPSIVRPSDDNMATMVTHMSDQCKIIETLIYYHDWMFDSESTAEDEVPEQHPSELNAPPTDPPQYGVGVPTGVSAASFNDMHNLIRKANEDQAAALMNEGKAGKIKNMLRRNSRRDKKNSAPTTSKGLKIESTAPAAVNPRYTPATPSVQSVESAFQGHYQERDIDAEIESRQTISPPGASGGTDGGMEESPSLESSLGSLPDSSRTDPLNDGEVLRKKRQQDMYSARRIFIAGSAAAASVDDNKALDAMASHTQHLNLAGTPALEVLSEETREKIRKMQKRQTWVDRPPRTMERSTDLLNVRKIDIFKGKGNI
ncbi:hypothetical protein WR25_10759 isoform E [Diploscapter pachys]|uniref:Rho-GAP domain-containing protein n=1 Tax=Diploscapter pachys TaxID=2018661 RepID=A0A2A2JBP8_9BILA|nr:hypothetical protein WR25_10759 isoform B [Diploscapter pachys]PAV59051.1 hypothetical protein WR25_10759 isoform C [Diploscapter pachys]PAV59053.1 hypothetical protein WR25_10759 isoform E [Diploscapter pachys]